MNSLFITLPAALIPSAFLLIYIYRKDLNREPISVILITFFLSLLIPIPVIVYHHSFCHLIPDSQNPILNAFFLSLFRAAIPEELCKFLLLFLFCMRRSAFDEEMDGLVYGAVSSLGFATIENVLYVSKLGFASAVSRAIMAVPAHAALGIIMGYFLVRWKSTRRLDYFCMSLLIPIALHTLHNFSLRSTGGAMQLEGFGYYLAALFFLLFLGYIIFTFLYAVKIINLFSRRQKNAAAVAKAFSEIQNELNSQHSSLSHPRDGHLPAVASATGRTSLPESIPVTAPPLLLNKETELQSAKPESTSGDGIVPMLIMGVFLFFFFAFLLWPAKNMEKKRPSENRVPLPVQKIVPNQEAITDVNKQNNTVVRFYVNGDGTITDKTTNLMWATTDNGKDVDWQQAKQYCESFRGGGYTGWRMPTQNESAGLYDAALKGYELKCFYAGIVKVPDHVTLSCFYLWSSDERESQASITDMRDGKYYWIDKKGSFFRNFRVLPVRSAR